MRQVFKRSVATLFACVAFVSGMVCAQSYPSRPITIVVPYGPGSGNDLIAREIAQRLAGILNTTVLVENKAGATGNIATDYVAQQKPDGYTIFLTSTSGIINQVSNPAVKTDLSKDFESIGFAAGLPYVVAVPPTVAAKSLSELVALAKANPGKLNYNGPAGSVSDYLGSMLKAAGNLDMVMIPYKSTSDAQVDVLAGRIQVWFTTAPSAIGLAESGKVRVLAVSPGLVRTEQSHLHYGDEKGIAAVSATIPLGRMADPADVAQACLYAASKRASYLSGTNILLHGGGERPAFLDAAQGR